MVMSESAQAEGLCSTCNARETCFYRAYRGPGLFCELFDDYVPQDGQGGRAAASADPTAFEDTSQFVGLCMNCEHRRTCIHPQPSGGVWHCEDYE